MDQKKSNRNYSLDILKFFMAFLIVIHHTPSSFHDFIQPFTTCAVPTFFMISGYLIFGRELSAQQILRNAIRIIMIFTWSLLLFYAWYWIRHSEPYIPNIKDLVLFVFANNEPVSGHLWYLMAYVYALFLIAFLVSMNKIHWLKYFAITGIVLYFIFDAWHIYKDIPKYLTLIYCFRNFFFTAIPLIYIGAAIRTKGLILNRGVSVMLLVVFCSCALFEINIFPVNHIADVFFMTIPVAITLFMLFANTKIYSPNIIATCGEKYSL